jgi:succinyl-CoA synthetase beta subunit
MKIHEYQAKAILARHGVPVPEGEVVFSAAEARGVAERLGGGTVVVKAQIHAGGRGKGGGVKVVKNPSEAEAAARAMLGMRLVTYQTGPDGQVVQRVLVEQGLQIARELYLGLVIDRASERPVIMASQEGGVEIEKVAAETPEKIFKEAVHPATGLNPFQARKLAFALGPRRAAGGPGRQAHFGRLQRLHGERRVAARDQSPHRDGRRAAAGPRREDELRRQRALPAPRHQGAARPRRGGAARGRGLEALAQLHQAGRHDRLHGQRRRAGDGDDGHHQAGGRGAGQLPRRRRRRPPSRSRTPSASSCRTQHVKAVLINIFGGILRCDILAEGVIAAVKELGVHVPVVIRMEGTNVERASRCSARAG